MLNSAVSSASRIFHTVVPRSATTHVATNGASASAAPVDAQQAAQARFVQEFQKAVVRVDRNRLEALLFAATTDQLRAAVNQVIPEGPRHVKPGDTPLHVLASRHTYSSRAAEMIKLLLRRGANPNAVNDARQTPAMRAFEKRQYPQLRALVGSRRYDPNTPMPRAVTEAGTGAETLLQHVHALRDYRAQAILDDVGPLTRLAPLHRVVNDPDEAGDVLRVLAQAGNAPPVYSARQEPPTYERFMNDVPPPPYEAPPAAPSTQGVSLLRRSQSA